MTRASFTVTLLPAATVKQVPLSFFLLFLFTVKNLLEERLILVCVFFWAWFLSWYFEFLSKVNEVIDKRIFRLLGQVPLNVALTNYFVDAFLI